MSIGEVRILKFHSGTVFSEQGYFYHLLNSRGVFASWSLLPNFCVLKALAPLVYGNAVLICQKSCFTAQIPIENNSIIYPKI